MQLKLLLVSIIWILTSDGLLAADLKFKVTGTSDLYINASEARQPKANMIAIIGGKGLRNNEGRSKNYLVRQRAMFAEQGINFYLFPNRSKGQKAGYRLRASRQRLDAISELVKFIKRQNNLPTFIAGFSRGSVDAGAYAKVHPQTIAGVILASGIYKNNSFKAADYSMEIIVGKRIDVPLLVAHHSKDQCRVTRFQYAKEFFENVTGPLKKLISFSDGSASGRACGPFHYHGFEGIEERVTVQIADWMLSQKKMN